MSITDFFDSLIPFFQNLITTMLNPINQVIINTFPNYNEVIPIINEWLYRVSIPINYLLDASFIYEITFTYIISSIVFRVSIKITLYAMKLVLKWWNTII